MSSTKRPRSGPSNPKGTYPFESWTSGGVVLALVMIAFDRAERKMGEDTPVGSVGQSGMAGKEHSAGCLEARTGMPIGQTLIGFQSEQAFKH